MYILGEEYDSYTGFTFDQEEPNTEPEEPEDRPFDYKESLIDGIEEFAPGRFTREELGKKSVRSLEIIFDHC